LTPLGYQSRVRELENRLDRLLTQDQRGTAAEKLFKRYVKHRDHLLSFLHHLKVRWSRFDGHEILLAESSNRYEKNSCYSRRQNASQV
jgi:hypothetical protein